MYLSTCHCRSYLAGNCKKGAACKFPHPPFDLQPRDGPPARMPKRDILVAHPNALKGVPEVGCCLSAAPLPVLPSVPVI